MKKIIYSAAFVCIGAMANAQSIPNGNFESWTLGTYDIPLNYTVCSNSQAFYSNMPFNEIKSTDSYHGSNAVQLSTVALANDTMFGYFLNANPNNGGGPSSWHGGFPYSQKPAGIRGYYKYNVATADSGTILVAFSKLGVNIGTYFFQVGGIKNTYTLFNFTLSPALSVTPDSVIFGALSCKLNASTQKPVGPAGSILKLDSVSFTGVNSQPALMNGDFELWQTQTLDKPNNWYIQEGGGNQTGVSQTADAYQGNYAAELITFLGNNNNHSVAQGGQISTGYYLNNCSGPNCQGGGYPFTNKIDTLVFWYKYVPMGNDSAQVNLNFKKNGSQIWSTGKQLSASAIYKYVQMPISIGQNPDTAIVQFQSSTWQDSALSFVGSDLKVDEVHFKSQPLNTGVPVFLIDNSISIYPNPSLDGTFYITNLNQNDELKIYNMIGEETKTSVSREKNISTVHLPIDSQGIYFVKVNSQGKIVTKKLIINR